MTIPVGKIVRQSTGWHRWDGQGWVLLPEQEQAVMAKRQRTKLKVGAAVGGGVAVLLLVVGVTGGTSSSTGGSSGAGAGAGSGGSQSLSEAFCSDLRSGMTVMNILGGSVQDGTYTPQEAADRAYGFAALSCPEELRSNEGLRTYLEGWGINPDA